MFDFALHLRFLQKATEALFEMGQASVAASLAWQSRLNDELTADRHSTASRVAATPPTFGWTPADGFAAWQMWLDCWAPVATPSRSNNVADAWQAWASPAAAAFIGGASGWQSIAANGWWNATPWSFYHGPLMTMMLSYGVPYAVAAPSARASTCAMDAADAACAQWRLMFANQNESVGTKRQPSVAPPWSTYLH